MPSTKTHVTHLVKLLTFVAKRNTVKHDATLFNTEEEDRPGLLPFVSRLDDLIRCSESCYATALVLIDRITAMNPDLTLNNNTVHKLFATSLLVANQFLDDTAERTLQFARVTNIDPLEMAHLKTDFVFRIQFKLVVGDHEVQFYSDKLQGRFSTQAFAEKKLWDGVPEQRSQVSESRSRRLEDKENSILRPAPKRHQTFASRPNNMTRHDSIVLPGMPMKSHKVSQHHHIQPFRVLAS